MASTLARRPRRRARPVAQAPLRIQYRTIHGYRRAYRMAGAGPVVLFIHGIGDCSDTWLDVLPYLTSSHTVIAPDLLGHGNSARPRADYSVAAYANGMRDLLAALGVDRVSVVGHSLGGGVAAQFAYQFPERSERLVLVSSGGVGHDVHPLLRLAATPGCELVLPLVTSAPVRALARGAAPRLARTGARRLFGVQHDLHYVLKRYDALTDTASRIAFLRTLRAVVDPHGQVVTMLDRCYLTQGIPTLLVHGEQDRIIPYTHAQRAHAAMPGSRLETFPDCGHFPHHGAAARFARLLRDFLGSSRPAAFNPAQWQQILSGGGRPGEVPSGEGGRSSPTVSSGT